MANDHVAHLSDQLQLQKHWTQSEALYKQNLDKAEQRRVAAESAAQKVQSQCDAKIAAAESKVRQEMQQLEARHVQQLQSIARAQARKTQLFHKLRALPQLAVTRVVVPKITEDQEVKTHDVDAMVHAAVEDIGVLERLPCTCQQNTARKRFKWSWA